MERIIVQMFSIALASGFAAGCSGAPPSAVGSSSGDSNSTQSLTHAEEFVAANGAFDAKMHLLARSYFNQRTEVVSLYEPEPGSYMMVGGTNPAGGHTAIPLPPNPTLSDVWQLLAAPGQEPPAPLAAMMQEEAKQPQVLVSPEPLRSRVLNPVQGAAPAPSEEFGPASVESLNNNYCSNGNFFIDFGGRVGRAPFWTWHGPRVNFPLNVDNEGYSSAAFVGQQNVFGSQVGAAFCSSNDSAIAFNGAMYAANVAVWFLQWGGWNCGWDLSCSGTRCTDHGTSMSPSWATQCPTSNGQCTDGNLAAYVIYAYASGSGCQY